LCHAFDTLQDTDWFIVVDAGSEVEPGFLPAMRQAMGDGVHAVQCRLGVRDALETLRGALADLALGACNMVRHRGRAALGLSAGILGDGFAVSRRALQLVPYRAADTAEDGDYHHRLLEAGLKVHWVDHATVRGDVPGKRLHALLGMPVNMVWKSCLAAATWQAARRNAVSSRSARGR
jgi:cellulose synthase/poly-beta-1,6-N-acetylglucosamine synthase-like glycosyltransferase